LNLRVFVVVVNSRMQFELIHADRLDRWANRYARCVPHAVHRLQRPGPVPHCQRPLREKRTARSAAAGATAVSMPSFAGLAIFRLISVLATPSGGVITIPALYPCHLCRSSILITAPGQCCQIRVHWPRPDGPTHATARRTPSETYPPRRRQQWPRDRSSACVPADRLRT
jgi:hypothetical protein